MGLLDQIREVRLGMRRDQDDFMALRLHLGQEPSEIKAVLLAKRDIHQDEVGALFFRLPKPVLMVDATPTTVMPSRSRRLVAACRNGVLSSTMRHRSGMPIASHARTARRIAGSSNRA